MSIRLMAPSMKVEPARGASSIPRPRRGDAVVRPGALRAPVVVAPMFGLSGPEMVVAACRAGLMGSFPAANARTAAELRCWLAEIAVGLRGVRDPQWAVSMIVHRDYDRFEPELELLVEHRPTVVVTELGSPRRVVESARGYGGAVFAGVGSVERALKAVDAGADGLVLECRVAEGIPGQMSPRAFLDAVRGFFDGPLVVGAALSGGRGVRAVEALGADLAYLGGRFAGCPEARLDVRHRDLSARSREDGVTATAAMTGVPRGWLAESVAAPGYGPDAAVSRAGRACGAGRVADVADVVVEEYLAAVFDASVLEPRHASRCASPRGASV